MLELPDGWPCKPTTGVGAWGVGSSSSVWQMRESGFEVTQSSRFGDRWSDAAALEAALFHGASRFRDPGRGQGLGGIARYVNRWSGKLAVRSGTARITIVPPWDDDEPLTDGLAPFPGSQVLMIVPAQDA